MVTQESPAAAEGDDDMSRIIGRTPDRPGFWARLRLRLRGWSIDTVGDYNRCAAWRGFPPILVHWLDVHDDGGLIIYKFTADDDVPEWDGPQ